MSLELLISAAEFIERKEREKEHGYASSLPGPDEAPHHSLHHYPSHHHHHRGSEDSAHHSHHHHHHSHHRSSNRRARARPKQVANRSTHNELEKNRRAHLRGCLEKLKSQVPLGPDGVRHTTLGLLNSAKGYIKSLEGIDRERLTVKEQLHRDQLHLHKRLEELGFHRQARLELLNKRRSVSESSTLSNESSSSSLSSSSCYSSSYSSSHRSVGSVESFSSESDEVDVLGYGSSSSPQSEPDDHWLGFRNSLMEPSLSGEIIGQGRASSSLPSPSFFCSASSSGTKQGTSTGFSLSSYRVGGSSDKYIKISTNRTAGRTISGSSTSSDGSVASLSRRLTDAHLPKINVVSAASLPRHTVRVATAL